MDLNISLDQVKLLYSQAGKPLEYVDQKFSYDSEVKVAENVRNWMSESLQRMGANFQPSEFQVKCPKICLGLPKKTQLVAVSSSW